MKAVITHPELQHAHQLAWALHDAGHLAAFWSGVPLVDAAHPSRGWGALSAHARRTPVPASLRRHFPAFPFLRRGIDRWASPANAYAMTHRLYHAFDRWAAPRIARLRPDMVICYENSALETFRAAKASGAVCILDAASVHYRAAAEFLEPPDRAAWRWIAARKQQEIELADAILTCSKFAAETYEAAGVPRDLLVPCSLGTALPQVKRIAGGSREKCRFVFVGTISHLKGVDVLLSVFEDLYRQSIPATLTLIGGVTDQALAERARAVPGITLHPFMPQAALFEEVARHDCLILPSRFDSFGMVVPEAMAVGVPAIVSDRVGAKSIIEEHPDAGWIVPFGADDLRQRIIALARDRGPLESASRAAEAAANAFSWAAYRSRVTGLIEQIWATRAASRTAYPAPVQPHQDTARVGNPNRLGIH